MNVEQLSQIHTISTHSFIHSQITSLPITSSVKFPYRIYVPHKSSVVEEGSFHWQLGTLRIYILGMRRREFGRGSSLVSSLIVYVPLLSLFCSLNCLRYVPSWFSGLIVGEERPAISTNHL